MNIGALVPLIAMLIIVFGVGIWASRHVRTSSSFLQEYFLGGRSLGGFILAMTMVATYGSASSFLGGPGEAYNQGLGWVLLSMTQVVTGYFVLMVLGKKFAIVSRKYEAITMVDFLKERYGSKWVVILSSFSIIISLFFAMAAQWMGGARLIEALTGLNYTSALFIFALAVLLYVIIGGFRAVAFTDGIQGTIMFIGTSILLIATIIAGGGINNIMSDLMNENPNLVTSFGAEANLSPIYVSSFWILVGVGVVALPQMAVRAMSYKDSRSMHRAIIIGTVVVGFIMLNMHLIGVFARPIVPGIDVQDMVMPLLALEVLPPWLAGIVLAAPMAAIMSTVDSLLILVSSSVVKDLYLNYIKPKASEKYVRRLSLTVTAIIGIIVFLMAIEPPDFIIWLNLLALGGLEAAFIWPVVLGLYWQKRDKYVAIVSIVSGVDLYVLLNPMDTATRNPFVEKITKWFSNLQKGVVEAIGQVEFLGELHPVVLPVVLSFFAYVLVSIFTHQKVVKE